MTACNELYQSIGIAIADTLVVIDIATQWLLTNDQETKTKMLSMVIIERNAPCIMGKKAANLALTVFAPTWQH